VLACILLSDIYLVSIFTENASYIEVSCCIVRKQSMSSYLLDGSTAVKFEIINFDEPDEPSQVQNLDVAAPPSPVHARPKAPLDTLSTEVVPSAKRYFPTGGTIGMEASERLAFLAAADNSGSASGASCISALGTGSGKGIDDSLGAPPHQLSLAGSMGMTSSACLGNASESSKLDTNLALPHPVASAPLKKPWNCAETSTVTWEESSNDELVRVNEYHVVKDLGSGSFGCVYVVRSSGYLGV